MFHLQLNAHRIKRSRQNSYACCVTRITIAVLGKIANRNRINLQYLISFFIQQMNTLDNAVTANRRNCEKNSSSRSIANSADEACRLIVPTNH